MIDIKEQQNMFLRIAEKLPKKLEIYAIGGTAMMFLGLKDKTIDVDLVFSSVEDRKIFKETVKLLDFKDTSAEIVYGKRENAPEMVKLGEVRLDLFLFKIISSYFSVGMQKRALQIHEFMDKLIIKVANPNDILVMKSVTSRDKDDEDIVSIIKDNRVDWNNIIEEAKTQVSMGNEVAILSLGEKLERLSNKKLISVPKEVLDKLWNLLNKQVKKKSKK